MANILVKAGPEVSGISYTPSFRTALVGSYLPVTASVPYTT